MMLKRILVISAIFVTMTQAALAGSFYLAPSLVFQDITAQHSSYRGFAPRFAVGYGTEIPETIVLVGAEIFGTYGSLLITNNHPNGEASVRTSREIGLSVLPGVRLNKSTIGFARLGVVTDVFSTSNTSKAGGQFGVGIETTMTDSWDIRGEYDYTAFGSVGQGRGSPGADTYMIGFVRRFA